ncbi:hypothetical protein COCMIDRAFT_52565, partial [Bipolaris oryzae ATCC 44560]
GATPSLECTDSSTAPTCACACSNGVTFNQKLSLNSLTTPTTPSDDTCQKDKVGCLQREQQLTMQL